MCEVIKVVGVVMLPVFTQTGTGKPLNTYACVNCVYY